MKNAVADNCSILSWFHCVICLHCGWLHCRNIQFAWVTSVFSSLLICTHAARASACETIHPYIPPPPWLRHVSGEVGPSSAAWLLHPSWGTSWSTWLASPFRKWEAWAQTTLYPNDNYWSAFLQAISTQLLQWAVTFNFTAWEHSDSVILMCLTISVILWSSCNFVPDIEWQKLQNWCHLPQWHMLIIMLSQQPGSLIPMLPGPGHTQFTTTDQTNKKDSRWWGRRQSPH